MSSAYYCELAYRSINILTTDPGDIRHRLPRAWDNGMSLINPDTLPGCCQPSIKGLKNLRREFTKDMDSHIAKKFGGAFASVRGIHRHPTLTRLAQLMLSIHAELETHYEMKVEEANNDRSLHL